ncbi:hypothetical protein C8R45DRAFT_761095, partial [Mycena sanguinolenta]
HMKAPGCAQLEQYPNFDFNRLFTTVAVKEESSEHIHLNWGDKLHCFAMVVPVGNYRGGHFRRLQLAVDLRFYQDLSLVVMTRLLAHCSSPLEGRRLVLTFF